MEITELTYMTIAQRIPDMASCKSLGFNLNLEYDALNLLESNTSNCSGFSNKVVAFAFRILTKWTEKVGGLNKASETAHLDMLRNAVRKVTAEDFVREIGL